MNAKKRGFVFVVGSTASGKSAFALEAAEKFTKPKAPSAILNADSIQLYRDLDIGSAKPTPVERARARHYLFDLAAAPEEMNLGAYHRAFFELLAGPELKTNLHFIVGGTGFYIQALEKGLWDIPKANAENQARLEVRLKSEGEHVLYRELTEIDPVQAAKIHARDHYRLLRFLDMAMATGRKPSEIFKEHEAKGSTFPEPHLKIGFRLSVEELRPRLEMRARAMLEQGLILEVQTLLQKGFRSWAPLQSVGYKETIEFLEIGARDEEVLVQSIVQSSLRLAKKQRTWFQRDPGIQWFHPLQKDAALDAVREFAVGLGR